MKKMVVLYRRCARRVYDMPSSPAALEPHGLLATYLTVTSQAPC